MWSGAAVVRLFFAVRPSVPPSELGLRSLALRLKPLNTEGRDGRTHFHTATVHATQRYIDRYIDRWTAE